VLWLEELRPIGDEVRLDALRGGYGPQAVK